MNEITKAAVECALERYGGKSEAKKYYESPEAYPVFIYNVESEWWTLLLAEYGWQLKDRAIRLWKVFHPEHFDDTGDWFKPEWDELFDIDTCLSCIATSALGRYIDNHPELQLDKVVVDNYLKSLFGKEPEQLRLF